MGIETYSLSAGSNTALFPEGMSPSAVNDGMRTVQSDLRTWYNDPVWIQYGDGDGGYTAAYASSSSFTIADADVTDEYHEGRRVKITGSLTGTVYGSIASSSYSDPNTTVTVTLDSGSLVSEALTVWLSIIGTTNSPIPNTVPLLSGANTWSAAQAFSDDVSVGGDLGVTGDLDVTTDATVGGTLGVTGAVTLDDDASVGGDLSVTGTINTYTLTSMCGASFADQSTAEAGSSTTTVMSPQGVAYAIADDDLLIGNRTSEGTALGTMEVAVKLTGGGLRRVLLSAVKTLVNAPDYEATGKEIPASADIASWTHGLGAEPAKVEYLLRCDDAGGDAGYSQNDAISVMTSDTQTNQYTLTAGRSATTLWVVVPANIAVRNKSTAAHTNIDKSKWSLEARAWL